LKISKEIKTGVIAIAAIGLLVTGVNFLKGNSFFGGDDVYYAYFPNSGQLAPASSVTLNGVGIGKVLAVDYEPEGNENEKVKVSFNVQNDDVKIPKGSIIQIGSLDLFNKGMILKLTDDLSKGYYKPGDKIPGEVAVDMVSQAKAYADPISQKLQTMMVSIDKVVNSVSSLLDTNSAQNLEGGLNELKIAIKRFGNVAYEAESLLATEKVKLGRILGNVESITENLKLSNSKVTAILGNAQKITEDLVSADFKKVIGDASKTLESVNTLIAKANSGEGTLGKLISDDALYNELVVTNKSLQNLVNDLNLHPERYIHFSVLGAKTKGVPLTSDEEKKLRKILEETPN
jgi:phospholipid/cholesterol/gamma-HCH transport system substrate-binding protein|tara:strand:- start:7471 stop:8508 length:1038 start_codon:yes stop_codon:yes gene_type:complete